MSARRILTTLVLASIMASGSGVLRGAFAQPAPLAPPGPVGTQGPVQSVEATPPRLSYISGEVSFWRPGAQDWAPAQLNTPLAPGDVLYVGQGANVELQIWPGDFVRAAEGTQIGLDNQEPDFVQFRVTSGHVALDLRQLAPGTTIELDAPNATFGIERTGYYHMDVDQDSTTFRAHRGGAATMTAVGGGAMSIAANQQVVVTGTDSPAVAMGVAPQLTAWDRWNYQRTDHLLQSASARYVSPAVYGTDALDQYGTWRTVETYGPVWVPAGVPAGWVPYSTGRWIWDPRFGWTWLDDAPWGWAPYHHGRWVLIDSYWAWAPGPVVVRPVYAPALVVFLGQLDVSVYRPVYWAPLSWGEPVIPWWGRPGFIGVPRWAGWGGPRVVNNIVINNNTTVNVTNITIYKNVNVSNAVVGVPADRFGRGRVEVVRVNHEDVRRLKPVRGAPEVRPVAASVMPATGPAIKPPAAIQARSVVATRPPKDWTPTLREHGLVATAEASRVAAPRLVPSHESAKASVKEPRPETGMAPGATRNVAPGEQQLEPEKKKGGGPVQALPPPPPGGKSGPLKQREIVKPETEVEKGKGRGPAQAAPPPPGAKLTGPPKVVWPQGEPDKKKGSGVVQAVPPAAPKAGGAARHKEVSAPQSEPENKKGNAAVQAVPPPGAKTAGPAKRREVAGPEGESEKKRGKEGGGGAAAGG